MLLRLDSVARSIAGRCLFQEASIEVRAGDRIGIVGPNGAGKTTLLRIAARIEPPDSGRVHSPRDVRIGMLRQEIDPRRATSVRDETASALAHLGDLENELRELEARIAAARDGVDGTLAERYDRVSQRFERSGGFSSDARIDAVLEGLGFDGDARARSLSSFSGGWLMRVELAKLLLSEPDVLLLDEPTNHLDLPAIQWFESVLEGFPGAAVVVSHDRTFLRKHATRIAEMDGRGGFAVYESGYDAYVAARAQRLEELRARRTTQDREIAHMERFVERFRYKASKARQAQSRIKALERMERVEVEEDAARGPRLRIPKPPRSGRIVLELDGVMKRYGENQVYDGLCFQLERGERVALVGPNGAGKSTLLRIAAGAVDFDAGERTLGHNVELGFFAQHQLESLDETLSVLEELETTALSEDVPRLRAHLGAFLFSGDDVAKKIGVLSGGEKSRVALARMLLRPSNLLVLDEPTNHLDMNACEVLERALSEYEGTLLFVSHDRSFINALASRVVEVRAGQLRSFAGGYDDYLRKLDQQDGNGDAGDHAVAAAGGAADAQSHAKRARMAEREQRKALERARRRFERLEREIHELEDRLEALGHELADPATYSDGDRFRGIERERQELRVRTDALYADWEARAAEIEELESDGRRASDSDAAPP